MVFFFWGEVGRGGKFMSFLLPFIWFASFVCSFNQVKELCVCMGLGANSLQELMFPRSIIRGNGKHRIHTHWAKKKEHQFPKLMKTHIIIIMIPKKLWVLGTARSRSYCSGAWFSPFKSCQSLLMISLTLWTCLKYIANTLIFLFLSLSLSLSLFTHRLTILHTCTISFLFHALEKSAPKHWVHNKVTCKVYSVGHEFGCQFGPPLVIFMPSQKLSM